MAKKDYGIKIRPITTRDPQSNAILECVHQTIGIIIRTLNVQDHKVLDDETLGIVSSIYHVLALCHSAHHYTTYPCPTSFQPRLNTLRQTRN